MTKFIDAEIFYKAFLASDLSDWRSELPQEGTAQTGRYTYDAVILEELTKFLVYVFPEPFSEGEDTCRVHLEVSQKVGFWVPLVTKEFQVDLSGAQTEFGNWPKTDDEILIKIAKIASGARPALRESFTVN